MPSRGRVQQAALQGSSLRGIALFPTAGALICPQATQGSATRCCIRTRLLATRGASLQRLISGRLWAAMKSLRIRSGLAEELGIKRWFLDREPGPEYSVM